jgi:hypothetical protein
MDVFELLEPNARRHCNYAHIARIADSLVASYTTDKETRAVVLKT